MPRQCTHRAAMAEAAGILAADRGAHSARRRHAGDARRQRGSMTEGTLLRITDPACWQMNTAGARIELGAGVTMAMVLANRDLSFLHPPRAASAARRCGNMATIGGNLFRRHALWRFHRRAAGARCAASRCMPATARRAPCRSRSFWRARARQVRAGRRRAVREPPDAARFPLPQGQPGEAQGRLGAVDRGASAAAGGRISGARIAYGAMGPTPLRAKAVERVLEGQASTPPPLPAAKTAALEGTHPATDAIASEWYRREVLPVHLGRLLDRRRTLKEAAWQRFPSSFASTAPTARCSPSAAETCSTPSGAGSAISRRNIGCGQGTCGVCTVLIDGEPQLACLTLSVACEGRHVETASGLADGPNAASAAGRLHGAISPRNAASARRAC